MQAILSLLLLAGLTLLATSLRRNRRLLRGRKRDFVELAVNYRSFCHELDLVEAADFLALEGTVVSGHPGRDVCRLTLRSNDQTINVFLKRERLVPLSVRWASFVAGFGWASRSVREARTLQALQREELGAAEWIAAGEDGQGQAFLLLRALDCAVDLRDFLRSTSDLKQRREAARLVGRELARLHDAGFAHPDLYAKHVLFDREAERVYFLDWQRGQRGRRVTWSARRRDLAALHATLAEELISSHERLVCLHAYVPRRPRCAVKKRPRPGFLRYLLTAVDEAAQRLRRRRHVVEKSQPVPPSERQEWQCIDGQALCITPSYREVWPQRGTAWLSLDRQPLPANSGVARRWLCATGEERALLVSRRQQLGWTSAWPALLGKPVSSPEQRLAGLLFRLQRHAVAAPRVLAMGQRTNSAGCIESFLLTVPAADAVQLETWLQRQTALGLRYHLLHETGALLQRLHGACCYFNNRDVTGMVAVCQDGSLCRLVLARPEAIQARRKPDSGAARRDLAAFERRLAAVGCSRTDLLRLRRGYQHDVLVRYRTEAAPPHRPQGVAAMLGQSVGGERTRREGLLRRLLHGSRRLREHPEWTRLVGPGWADRIMTVGVTDRFHAKQGRSTGRWVVPQTESGSPLVTYLKRHYSLPWWSRLLALLWPRGGFSPAMQEWRHLEWARAQGVPVPETLAAAEYIGPGFRLQSFLAVKELTDMLPLHEAVPLAAARLNPTDFRLWKRTLAVELARLTRLLHDRRCFHKDLYFCHFYLARTDTAFCPAQAEPWRGRVFLIDLHRLAHHPVARLMWQTKDLAQLLYSSEIDGIDARDRLSFWKAYRGSGPRLALDRWLRGWVLFKWGRYRRHNARRKARVEAARQRQAS